MNKKTINDFIKERNAAEETFREKMEKQGQKLISEEFVKFFQENPEIQSVRWHGYTPYFNDGDECIYGVDSPVFTFTDEFKEALVGKTRKYKHYQYVNDKYTSVDTEEVLKDIDAVTSILEEDVYEYGEQLSTLEGLGNKVSTRLQKNIEKLGNFITDLDDACKLIFGDHAEISFTRGENAFVVEEYSHD